MLSAFAIAGLSVYALRHGVTANGLGYSIGRAMGQLIFAAIVAVIGGIGLLTKAKPESRAKMVNGVLVLLGTVFFGVLVFFLMMKWL